MTFADPAARLALSQSRPQPFGSSQGPALHGGQYPVVGGIDQQRTGMGEIVQHGLANLRWIAESRDGIGYWNDAMKFGQLAGQRIQMAGFQAASGQRPVQ